MAEDAHRRIAPKRIGAGAAAVIVVAAMILAALSMWTVIPLGWLWVGSQLSEGQDPSGGPYLVVFIGFVSSIVLVSWLLGRLNRVYVRLTGTTSVAPMRPAWLKSMRDERGAPRMPTMLEAVVVTSVILAILAMAGWFLFLAGSPLPSQ
jgi:hypothetical protein